MLTFAYLLRENFKMEKQIIRYSTWTMSWPQWSLRCLFPSRVPHWGHNMSALKSIFISFLKIYFLTPWKSRYIRYMYADVQLQSPPCSIKLHTYVVPISPYEVIICFLPFASVLGLSTAIHNDTCWWKHCENSSGDLFCCMLAVSLLALDLVVCICLMKRGCFNLLDCPPWEVSSLS